MENNYCPYCMSTISEGTVCPVCGLDNGSYHPNIYHIPPGTVLKDRYLVGRVLGEGGFGITYIGRDLQLEMKVAIKEYYPKDRVSRLAEATLTVSSAYGNAAENSYEKGKQKFLEEARVMARLTKEPSIVRVQDFFEINNTAYIVMEYIEGTTLRELVDQRGGKIPPDELFKLIEPLFGSMQTMHDMKLLHRDISPDNIMIESGKVRLLDFGCAREAITNNETLTVQLKHGYAPIEQYQQKGGQGAWTDVYAFCATIYFCLTGIKPPSATNRIAVDELLRPTKLGVPLTESQERAILHGLRIQQSRRTQSMKELHAELYLGVRPDPFDTGTVVITSENKTPSDPMPEISGNITVSGANVDPYGNYGDVNLSDGKGSFRIGAGQTCEISELPAGSVYTVKAFGVNGYNIETLRSSGTVEAGTSKAVIVSASKISPPKPPAPPIRKSNDPDVTVSMDGISSGGTNNAGGSSQSVNRNTQTGGAKPSNKKQTTQPKAPKPPKPPKPQKQKVPKDQNDKSAKKRVIIRRVLLILVVLILIAACAALAGVYLLGRSGTSLPPNARIIFEQPFSFETSGMTAGTRLILLEAGSEPMNDFLEQIQENRAVVFFDFRDKPSAFSCGFMPSSLRITTPLAAKGNYYGDAGYAIDGNGMYGLIEPAGLVDSAVGLYITGDFPSNNETGTLYVLTTSEDMQLPKVASDTNKANTEGSGLSVEERSKLKVGSLAEGEKRVFELVENLTPKDGSVTLEDLGLTDDDGRVLAEALRVPYSKLHIRFVNEYDKDCTAKMECSNGNGGLISEDISAEQSENEYIIDGAAVYDAYARNKTAASTLTLSAGFPDQEMPVYLYVTAPEEFVHPDVGPISLGTSEAAAGQTVSLNGDELFFEKWGEGYSLTVIADSGRFNIGLTDYSGEYSAVQPEGQVGGFYEYTVDLGTAKEASITFEDADVSHGFEWQIHRTVSYTPQFEGMPTVSVYTYNYDAGVPWTTYMSKSVTRTPSTMRFTLNGSEIRRQAESCINAGSMIELGVMIDAPFDNSKFEKVSSNLYDGKYVHIVLEYDEIIVSATGYPDVVVPGGSIDEYCHIWDNGGWTVGTGYRYNLTGAIIDALGLTHEEFVNNYCSNINMISISKAKCTGVEYMDTPDGDGGSVFKESDATVAIGMNLRSSASQISIKDLIGGRYDESWEDGNYSIEVFCPQGMMRMPFELADGTSGEYTNTSHFTFDLTKYSAAALAIYPEFHPETDPEAIYWRVFRNDMEPAAREGN